MIRVLIADDHPLLRNGLKQVFSMEPDLDIPGEAQDSAQVLERIEQQPWDVVVLDISMPGRNGLDALREIRRRRPNLPVLILSMYAEEQFAIRAFKAGADGYVNKANDPQEVVRAIRKIISGKKYVSASLAETLADALHQHEGRAPHELLSDRELQVMCRIAAGQTVSQIASEISLSVKTVSTYRTRILEKMSLRTNAELTRYALKHGFVE